MRRVWLFLLLLLWPLAIVQAQCPGMTTQQTAFATEKLTISDVATPLTASVYKPSGITPSMAMVSVEGGAIRYQVITAVPPTDGQPVNGGATFPICGYDSIAAFKAIRITSDALLTVIYYKPK